MSRISNIAGPECALIHLTLTMYEREISEQAAKRLGRPLNQIKLVVTGDGWVTHVCWSDLVVATIRYHSTPMPENEGMATLSAELIWEPLP